MRGVIDLRGVTASELLCAAASPHDPGEHGHVIAVGGVVAYGVAVGGVAVFVAADRAPRVLSGVVRLNAPELLAMLREVAATPAFAVELGAVAGLADHCAAPWARWYHQGEREPLTFDRTALARVLSTAGAWGAQGVTACVVPGAAPCLGDEGARLLVFRSEDGWCGAVAEALHVPDGADVCVVNEGELL